MAIEVKHNFVHPLADAGSPDEVGPDEWNANHGISLASGYVIGRTSAGAGPAEEIAISSLGGVQGPASAVNNRIAVFDGITGKLIKDGGVTVAQLSSAPSMIDVKIQYGATGDGVTDDTAAINAAIADANSSRKIIFFPPGTYRVSTLNPITGLGVIVQGSGRRSTVIATFSAGGDVMTMQGQFQSIEDIAFIPSVFRTGGYELAIKFGAFQHIVRNVYINFGHNGIYNIDASETIFENVQLRYLTGTIGYYYTGTAGLGSYGMRIKNILTDNPYVLNVFNNNLKGNFAASTAYAAGDVFVANNWIWQVTTAGTSGTGSPPAPTNTSWYTTSIANGSLQCRAISSASLYWIVMDNYANSLTVVGAALIDGYGGFKMQNSSGIAAARPLWAFLYDLEIDHPYAVGCDLQAGAGFLMQTGWIGSTYLGNGIQFGAGWLGEVSIEGSRIVANGQHGILVNGGIDTKITGNILCNNGINGPSGTYHGCLIAAGITRFTIQNNTTGTDVFSASTLQGYGIAISTGCDFFSIIGNLGRANATGNVLNNSGTGANKIVANNN
jgi:hypothetical protein